MTFFSFRLTLPVCAFAGIVVKKIKLSTSNKFVTQKFVLLRLNLIKC